MVDWQTVRFDPAYAEPLDPEIIPLCDALNAAGFVTTTSCCGHGTRWPSVTFEHSDDGRIESLARFVMSREGGDYRPHYTMWQKEVLGDGYLWSVHVHINEAYSDTSPDVCLEWAVSAINSTARSVALWSESAAASPAGQAPGMEEITCEKVQHIGGGYLHDDDDDSPYDVDGVMYCGRCHRPWPHSAIYGPMYDAARARTKKARAALLTAISSRAASVPGAGEERR